MDEKWIPKFPKRIQNAFREYPNIVSNRGICSGAPCVSGRRIPVYVLSGRYAAGERVSVIAQDYDLRVRDVVDAIRFALWVGDVDRIKFWKFYHLQADGGQVTHPTEVSSGDTL